MQTLKEQRKLNHGQNSNQSKITLVLGTFKPLKSAGTDESVPALLQRD
jgi:hypothetical protein